MTVVCMVELRVGVVGRTMRRREGKWGSFAFLRTYNKIFYKKFPVYAHLKIFYKKFRIYTPSK